jgi:RES domain-containing protein
MTPHPESPRLARAVRRCLPMAGPWTGVLYRSASPRYANWDDLLTGVGSKTAGARWNPPSSFRTVYTSLEVETALAESLAHFRDYELPLSRALPRVLVALEAKVRRILDLTDGGVRRALAVSEHRLRTEPWREQNRRGREAVTQSLGRLAYRADLEGLLVPSAARPDGRNLILFPANLGGPGSWLRLLNKDELPAFFEPM